MKKQLKCVHNEAINPELGAVCKLREPNSLCEDCKSYQSKIIEDKEIFNEAIVIKAIDELYSQYEADHSLRNIIYIHPMFYNGTFSEDNSCIPDEPEELLTKEEFESKLEDIDYKWRFGLEVLYCYIMKQSLIKN